MKQFSFVDKILDRIPVFSENDLFESLFKAFEKVFTVLGIESLHDPLSVKLNERVVIDVDVINIIKAVTKCVRDIGILVEFTHMHLEFDLFRHVGAAAFKTHAARVLVISLAMILQENDSTRLVVPGILQFRHFAAGHLVHKLGINLVIRDVYIVAPQIVEVFGERFFVES